MSKQSRRRGKKAAKKRSSAAKVTATRTQRPTGVSLDGSSANGESARSTGRRNVPYVVLLASVSSFLEARPQVLRIWLDPHPPWWLADATILVGIIVVWVFARALIISQLRAMSLGEGFRDDRTVRELLDVALARTGIFALWATLLGFLSVAINPLPEGVKVTDAIGTYATLGAIIGLTLCVIKSYLVYRSSFKLLRRGETANHKYWVLAHISAMFCDLLVMLPMLLLVGRLLNGPSA